MKVNAATAAASKAMMVSSDPVARVDECEAERETAQSKGESER
jgi:hypothetical protein